MDPLDLKTINRLRHAFGVSDHHERHGDYALWSFDERPKSHDAVLHRIYTRPDSAKPHCVNCEQYILRCVTLP